MIARPAGVALEADLERTVLDHRLDLGERLLVRLDVHRLLRADLDGRAHARRDVHRVERRHGPIFGLGQCSGGEQDGDGERAHGNLPGLAGSVPS